MLSEFKEMGPVDLPAQTGIRVMMLPFIMEDLDSLPDRLINWKPAVKTLTKYADTKGVGYLTIDERLVGGGGISSTPRPTRRRRRRLGWRRFCPLG